MLDAVERERPVAVRSAVVDDDVGDLGEPPAGGMARLEGGRVFDRT